jgi:hypothetical protein
VLVAFLPINLIVLSVVVGLALIGLLAGLGGGGNDASATELTLLFESEASAGAASAAGRPAGWLSLPGNVPLACLVVFVASFCSLAIELAASRILAPHVGVSLYSWTGIIGVVLAGIAVGNFVGGRIADRWSSPIVLGSACS